jgi:hypothetical protein
MHDGSSGISPVTGADAIGRVGEQQLPVSTPLKYRPSVMG